MTLYEAETLDMTTATPEQRKEALETMKAFLESFETPVLREQGLDENSH